MLDREQVAALARKELLTEPRGLSDRWAHAGLAIITLAALFLRLHDLGAKSLWFDEGYTNSITQLPFHAISTSFVDTNPPLYWIVEWVFARFSDGEAGLRLSSALFGAASVPVLYFLSRRYLGRAGALAAAGFLAVATTHLGYSQNARTYSLQVFLLILSGLCLLHSFDQKREDAAAQPISQRWIVAYGVTAILALYSHVSTLFFIAVINFAALPWIIALARRRLRDVEWWFGVNVVVALAALPLIWLGMHGGDTGISWLRRPGGAEALQTFFGVITSNNVGLKRQILLILIVALGGVVAFVRTPRAFSIALLTMLIGLPLVIWLFSFVKPMFMERTILMALIGGALAFGALIAYVRRPIAAGVLICAVIGLQGLSLAQYYKQPPFEDWRGAVDYVNGQVQSGDAVLLCARQGYDIFSFYNKSDAEIYAWWDDAHAATPILIDHARWLSYRAMPYLEQLKLDVPDVARAYFAGPQAQAIDPVALFASHRKVWVVDGHCSNFRPINEAARASGAPLSFRRDFPPVRVSVSER